ncbi:Translation initiation factor IF-3 [bacterium HR17]|uniref:Translation initiation factor IF-3 n=1 Tax=Candidatus Fervidibacter japonicus TaxID=2035412 RepID=A0A2H5X9W5_9BACT|nr:Translation initiation factor IF-3 [bacterium HR17]
MNEQIRIPRVLVIDENGQKLGVMDTRDALRLARSKGLDLIEVAPHARPPVCRIMDYGKFKYQQQKRAKEARKHHKELKEIRLTPQISEHDLMHRVRSAEEFLQEGHRVRVFMQVRGRWAAHMDLGEAKLRHFAEQLSHLAVVESPIQHQGNVLSLLLAPRKEMKKPTEGVRPAATGAPPPPSTPSQPPTPSAQPPAPSQPDAPKVIEAVSSDQ